jgi:hypothetical protein
MTDRMDTNPKINKARFLVQKKKLSDETRKKEKKSKEKNQVNLGLE